MGASPSTSPTAASTAGAGPPPPLGPGPGRTLAPRLVGALGALLLGVCAACGDAASPAAPSAGSNAPTASTAAGASEHSPVPPPGAQTAPEAEGLGTLPGERAIADTRFAAKYAKSAAANDDWDTEQVSEELNAALVPLKAWLTHAAGDRPSLEDTVAGELRGTSLRPADLAPDFEGEVFSVGRATAELAEPRATDLESELTGLLDAFGGRPAQRVKFKLVEVVPDLDSGAEGQRVAARFLVQVSGPAPAGLSSTGDEAATRVQINATWDCEFALADGAAPRLALVRVTHYTEATSNESAAFEDITEAVLGQNAAFRQQLSVGLDAWAGRVDAALGMSIIGHEGLAVGDADGDGLDDLYVCQPGGLPNLLFVRAADGTALERGAAAGLDFLDGSRSALFLDLDGDGDQDLVVESDPLVLVLENDGDARFTLRAEVPAPATTSLSAADFDGDGDLDLFACGYMLPDTEQRTPIPYHDANNGRPNTLLRNDLAEAEEGGGTLWAFTDVTRASGLDRNNRRYSFAAAWEDYDDDGDPDLYVANDFGRNNLYRNDAGQFTDVAAAAGVEDISAGMGVAWSDLDRDGHMDLYVSNMFSSAGGRIAYQRRFHAGDSPDARGQYQRHARGNTLFRNLGDGSFADVSEEAGVTMGRWAWGSIATDLQNDGWPDLFIPNGFVTGADPADL